MKSFYYLPLAFLLWMDIVLAGNAVDWAQLNPAFQGASFVNDPKICMECHEPILVHYSEEIRAEDTRASSKKSAHKLPEAGKCEACHGPRSKHIEEGGGRKLALTTTQRSAVCLKCHQDGARKHWKGSTHEVAGLGCASCHTLMQKKSERNLLSESKEDSLCYTCHANIRAETNKSSHHPIREGKVTCSDCHLPHGSSNRTLLKGASVNETCFGCHQEKRGPFLWEHPPVRENCMNCHEAHGSNNNKLQNSKDGFLCLQCHTYGGHINLPRYNRVSTLSGEGCVNCHMTIHGSNSPSGRKLTR